MEKFKRKGSRERVYTLLKLVFFSLLISLLLVFGISYIGKVGNDQNIILTREAVMRTAVECYAIEGIYPPNIEYMQENYNFSYDTTKYYIHYDIFASNIMPTVEVYEKR